jgi:hypothetical protein
VIRLALVGALVALAACTPQMTEDALSGSQARCAEAQRLYDADRNTTAGLLVVATCMG